MVFADHSQQGQADADWIPLIFERAIFPTAGETVESANQATLLRQMQATLAFVPGSLAQDLHWAKP